MLLLTVNGEPDLWVVVLIRYLPYIKRVLAGVGKETEEENQRVGGRKTIWMDFPLKKNTMQHFFYKCSMMQNMTSLCEKLKASYKFVCCAVKPGMNQKAQNRFMNRSLRKIQADL